MFSALKRWWRYMAARLDKGLDDRADLAVQLEQAMAEAQDQHRRLREQAANVIANQKQLELRLTRNLEDYERVAANTRQAVLMAEGARTAGDDEKATEYAHVAESFANRMIALEAEVDEDKQLALQAAQTAEQARLAVQQNAEALQRKLAERQKLLSQLDQAKLQEQMNVAMTSLTATVGQDVPSIEQVRAKIETRYARAKGMAELGGDDVEARMLEVEKASRNVEAHARLEEIKAQLGLPPGAPASDRGAVDASSADD
jgi:phage shock protein A